MTDLLQQKIILSISILISHRPDTVEKCLKSLDRLRRRVLSELILVDTGCGEQVRKIIESYADKIVNFEWCNDFSKARNAGLKQAKGEWFLYLDDDEWFEDTDEIENFFLSGKYLRYNCGSYLQRNYMDPEGKKYRDEYVGRLIRLEPDMEFIYSIHEIFSKVRMPRIRLHSYVHHYGYVFNNEEEMRRHSQRNIGLLLAEHEKDPAELRHNAQLAQEYNALKECEKSIEISLEGIQNAGTGISTEQFLGGLYVNAVRNYVVLEQYVSAIELGEIFLTLENSDELNRAAVCYNLCMAYLEKEECAKSLEAAEQYLDFYGKWRDDRDATAFYEHLALPFLCEECRQDALCVTVQDGIKLGNADLAKKYFDKINWNTKKSLVEHRVQNMVRVLINVWLHTDTSGAQNYTAMMRTLLKDGVLARMVEREIDFLRKRSPELLHTKKADWAALADENWIFLYLKLKNQVETNRDTLTEDYCKLWKEPIDSFMKAKELELWEMARQDNVDMGQIISGVPLYRWEKAVEIAVEELDWQDAQEMQRHLQEALDINGFHMLYWSIPYRMRKIRIMADVRDRKGISIGDLTESIVKELLTYAAESESLSRRLYREDLFREMHELLPQGCQVSLKLLNMAEAVEKGDLQRALNDVKEALQIMPELSDVLKYCPKWLSKKSAAQNAEQENARDEMKKLAKAVKVQVYNMISQGLLSEAASVLCQLKAMVPEDEEVMGLEKEIQRSRSKKQY